MTKSQLVDKVTDRGSYPRKAIEASVNAIFDGMVEALQREERIEVRGLGNFTVRRYKAYTGRNPKTGEQVRVPAKRMPFFKVGKDLRKRINEE
ncbi:MAG: HU family DNA-binding protein [Myxococcota bacterium]